MNQTIPPPVTFKNQGDGTQNPNAGSGPRKQRSTAKLRSRLKKIKVHEEQRGVCGWREDVRGYRWPLGDIWAVYMHDTSQSRVMRPSGTGTPQPPDRRILHRLLQHFSSQSSKLQSWCSRHQASPASRMAGVQEATPAESPV
jgi:hypothetical protein